MLVIKAMSTSSPKALFYVDNTHPSVKKFKSEQLPQPLLYVADESTKSKAKSIPTYTISKKSQIDLLFILYAYLILAVKKHSKILILHN